MCVCVCVCVCDYAPCRNLNNEAARPEWCSCVTKKKVATFRPSFCNDLNYNCQYMYDLL